jgi:thiamine biosynthesis lipoprotein
MPVGQVVDAEADVEAAEEWPLWGGTARVVVRVPQADAARAATDRHTAVASVRAVVAAVDSACSRFRPDSEVVRLGRARGRAVPVSPVLADAVAAALRAARVTDGAVDPTIGAAMVAAGYDRDLAVLPPHRPAGLVAARRRADWRDVCLDRTAGTLRVPDGVVLDLGATAKAWAADRAAAAAHAATGRPVLVGLCGDLAATGTHSGTPWVVGVRERPEDADTALVAVEDGGLATSTTRSRRWRMAGRPVHHLLDPVTGLPVREVWRSVTVAAASCLDANTASTATVVKGPAGAGWLAATGLPARLVSADGRVELLGGWPAGAQDRVA